MLKQEKDFMNSFQKDDLKHKMKPIFNKTPSLDLTFNGSAVALSNSLFLSQRKVWNEKNWNCWTGLWAGDNFFGENYLSFFFNKAWMPDHPPSIYTRNFKLCHTLYLHTYLGIPPSLPLTQHHIGGYLSTVECMHVCTIPNVKIDRLQHLKKTLFPVPSFVRLYA